MTMTELDHELERLRGSVLFDARPVRALYRAALARTEAAEARVAELEAALAAQQWRPGSETPNAIDTYLVYRAAPPQNEPWRYDFAVWEDDGWDTEGFTHYRPLPPAPQETE